MTRQRLHTTDQLLLLTDSEAKRQIINVSIL
jgi:hypothetical protein